MRTVPFLNSKGEVVGKATISQDGVEAWITVEADAEVLRELVDTNELSLAYRPMSMDELSKLSVTASGSIDSLKAASVVRRSHFVAQRHARINCKGEDCGENNCDTCHPEAGSLLDLPQG